jgi:GNAT superfamily N-acetyltransferase
MCDSGPVAITVQPVSEALFDDVQTVFGTRGQAARCQCQGYRLGWHAQHSDNVQGRRELLRDQVIEGHGLVAYLDGEPVGWCSLAPRSDYPYLRQTTWKGRTEDKDDASIWAVTCFVTRAGFRRQGVSRALAAGTIDLARDRGARVVEAYPMKPAPGKDVTWGEMHVGALSAFLAAGFRIVHVPSLRRAIVRYDF